MFIELRRYLVATVLLTLAGCEFAACDNPPGADARHDEQAAAPHTTSSAPSWSVGGVIRQARRGFHKDNEGWHAGGAGYELAAGAQGFMVRPWRRKTAESSRSWAQQARFGPAQVSCGDWRWSRPGHTVRDSRTHLVARRGLVREHLRNRAGGVEQSWAFDSRPPCGGDLVVKLPVSGQRFASRTASGLHFEDEETGMGLRYGHGTWIDARGERHGVPARFRDGRIELRVPAKVVSESSFPAVLDPQVSPEFGFDEDLIVDEQLDPDVAFDGHNYLVVWSEDRSPDGGGKDIYGARVTPDGTVLDVPAMRIGHAATGDAVLPTVAAGDERFLVTWVEEAAGGSVKGARVNWQGILLDSPPLDIASGVAASVDDFGEAPDIAYGGGVFMVVTATRDGLFTTLVDALAPAGNLTPVELDTDEGMKTAAVTFLARSFLIVWTKASTQNALFRRYIGVDGVGMYGGSGSIVYYPDMQLSNLHLAFDGENALLVWRRTPSNGPLCSMMASRILSNRSLSPEGGARVVSTACDKEVESSMVFDGSSFLLVLAQASEVRGGTIGVEGNILLRDFRALTSEQGLHTLALTAEHPGRALLASQADTAVRGRFIDYSGHLAAFYQALTIDEDQAVDVELRGYDPGNRALQFAIEQEPRNGALSGTPPNIEYKPDHNYNGGDRFVFSVTNPDGESATATVWLTVQPVPDAPQASDDEATTPEDEPIDINVLANDTDSETPMLVVSDFTQPAHGEARRVSPARIRYTPQRGFVGVDSFDYTISDPGGLTDTAQVRVRVGEVVTPPADAGVDASAPDAGPADSDGDGVADGVDACPQTYGAGQDGCPTDDEIKWGENRPAERGCACGSAGGSAPGGAWALLAVVGLVFGYRRSRGGLHSVTESKHPAP